MRHYKIREGGFKEIKKQLLIRSLPIMLLAAAFGIIITFINSKSTTADVNVLPIIIPLIAIALAFGLYLGINRQKDLLRSYRLTLTNNLITREQVNTPTVSIYFTDVDQIVKNKNGSFIVKGKTATDLIVIPAQIEEYTELENLLLQIKPFSTKSNSFFQRYSIIISILTLVLMLCVYTSTNKTIVALSGTTLVAILAWSFYVTRKSKNIDVKTKRSMWWVLIVMASIITVMIAKLF
jgi:hypothetical protein